MLKRASRFFSLFFSCVALFIMLLPVHVFADSPTYTIFEGNNCYFNVFKVSSNVYDVEFTTDVRAVFLSANGVTGYVWFVSDSSFVYSSTSGGTDQCTVPFIPSTGYGGNYYYFKSSNNSYLDNNPSDIPTVIVDSFGSVDTAIYYTYGPGAVDPEEIINYGNIDNLSYSTNIAGSGSAAINNIDNIKWNPITDDVGNELPEDAIINIRAVPGKYTANSKQGLLEKLYSDFILNSTDFVLLASISASQEEYQVSWRSVVDRLNIPFSSINSLISTDETWLKYGWVYECQLSIPSAEYVGEWQMVYTSTSSGVENDLTIIDNSIGISQTLINVMQNINTINDNDSIWYFNDVPVNPNPEYKPPEDENEEPWYMKILEMIYNSLGLTNQYINEGTNESNNVVNEFNNDNNDLIVNINEYDDIEDDIIDDFNENVQELDIDNELYQNSNFISSARWISEQFTTLISDNPIGSILKFSLIFGFILIFLGRFR